MPQNSEHTDMTDERIELPIEKGFPIEHVNDIAEKEGRAKQHYRPTSTLHKWWARRLGCVFRTICLYTLVNKQSDVEIFEPGSNNQTLSDYTTNEGEIKELIDSVDMSNPNALWELYPKDVRVSDTKILDPFVGGGTSLVEASRFGTESVGRDLNPVAWFITKKTMDAGSTSVEKIEEKFSELRDSVGEEILDYYKTPCPNYDDHRADVMYNFWVKELDCASCEATVPLYRDFRIAKGRYENDGKHNVLCPSCESVVLVEDWQGECVCNECGFNFNPSEGNVDYGDYICHECGQKYPVIDAIQEQNGFNLRLYAIEYHCPTCQERGAEKSEIKGYKKVEQEDQEIFQEAKKEWKNSPELGKYVPDKPIRPGWSTMAYEFEGSMSGNGNLPRHGYENWTDLFNDRQLLSLSKLLKEIDEIEDDNLREMFTLCVTNSLRTNCMMVSYDANRNGMSNLFRTNRLNPPLYPTEGNVWGAKYGRGTFQSSYNMLKSAVEYAKSPTERYVDEGETKETNPFSKAIGENTTVEQGDVRELSEENEYDFVISDPPYYNNVLYSELSDFFYVWLKPMLESDYDFFEKEHTPRAESIVVNPAANKGDKEFESELEHAFSKIQDALKDDGALVFTYHHSSSESWGELLESLCNVGFEITATYPISADINKFMEGEMVSFDIIVVARPSANRTSTSWNSLRRNIYRTARHTRRQLEENRELSRGDIGVIEMGECFREYSKHHGKVQRDGEIMSAKEVVKEIYGIIQEASDIGVEDVFIDLLDSSDPSFDDVNKLCRGTNATPEELKEMRLYNQDDGFELGTWDNEKRQAYIQERVNGDSGDHLSNLDKLQFLRYRYEKGQAVQNYVDKWGVDDDLRELAGRLADVTGDDTYTRVLGDRDITSY